ncbi:MULTISPECIES: hypothetical protein [unclassified Streptomyces]|uniref:hypothetical protein n=1 Tax=unclassified Streptomyces TaxID=2593676 RepID=UPI00131BB293|nr:MULTISPECIES: hypothetical protein [unclassified Streptomyces]
MIQHRALLAGGMLVLLACTGCGGDESAHGGDALKHACDGVLDSAAIKEASKSDKFSRLHDVSKSESHASAAKTLIKEDHAAFVCDIGIDDAPPGGNHGLSIKFAPNVGHLFSEEENKSYSSYKAYKLGGGSQATIESGSADVYFTCKRSDTTDPMTVTGTLVNDLDLSEEARLRIIFRSSLKMVKLLKCANAIKFPAPETMKPLPMDKD